MEEGNEIRDLADVAIPAGVPVEERIAMARRHARLLAEREGRNIVRMRKHAMWYLKGMRGATAARRAINDAVTFNDFATIFHDVAALQKSGEEQA